eukprot:5003741-Pleurochrysis_carterae.AAC.3
MSNYFGGHAPRVASQVDDDSAVNLRRMLFYLGHMRCYDHVLVGTHPRTRGAETHARSRVATAPPLEPAPSPAPSTTVRVASGADASHA